MSDSENPSSGVLSQAVDELVGTAPVDGASSISSMDVATRVPSEQHQRDNRNDNARPS
ncbi:hypothetical protein ACFXBB_31680 [Streptomyces scopuliridis]|uniref:hypothetical protein n=1 Tax=Streptomyces scopuliridis TaxID=452529 RepID=UPI00367E8422